MRDLLERIQINIPTYYIITIHTEYFCIIQIEKKKLLVTQVLEVIY